jgi:GTPase SAR1 family protein
MNTRYDVKSLKALLIGAPKTGKSKLLSYMMFRPVNLQDYEETVGIESQTRHTHMISAIFGDIHWDIQIWDMSGYENYRSFYNDNNDITCFCFIIDATQDFQMQKAYLEKILPATRQDTQSFVVITKRDLVTPAKLAEINQNAVGFAHELAKKDFYVESIIATSLASLYYDDGVTHLNNQMSFERLRKVGDPSYNNEDKYQVLSDEQRQAKYQQEKETFTKFFQCYNSDEDLDADLDFGIDHRAEAVSTFKRLLHQSKNDPDRIATLIEVAKPYINRHRNWCFDTLFGKHNTNTWSDVLKEARETALETINELTVKKSVSETELNTWRRHSLFAEHRNNFSFLGAFGNTKAQVKIDNLIRQLKM